MSSTAPALAVRRLRKSFGAVVAVDEVSLDVAPGEFLSLLGPSGCGKTTLLRIVAGLVEPDGGEVVLAGGTARLAGLAPALQRLVGVNVRVGDPLVGISVGKKVKGGMPDPSLAVPIGLGMAL